MSRHQQQSPMPWIIQVESMYNQHSFIKKREHSKFNFPHKSIEYLQHIFFVDPFEVNDTHYDEVLVRCQVIQQDLYDSNHLLHKVTIFSMVLNFLNKEIIEVRSKIKVPTSTNNLSW